MTIKAIFYDLDGTLRVNLPAGWRVFSDYALELGTPVTEESLLKTGRWVHYYFAESAELHADKRAFSDARSFWENFSYRQLISLGSSQQDATELAPVIHNYMLSDYQPVDTVPDDLIHTLKTLKSQGYVLGVMSNRDKPFSDYLSELHLAEFFTTTICAGEAGIYKPNPGVFHYMLDKAGVSAGDSLYVGDNYYADIVGARNAGLTPVLLDVDGIFEDADCEVIQSHSQVLTLLNNLA